MRHSALILWAALPVVGVGLGCTKEDPASTVLVSVASDLAAPMEIDSVEIVVAGGELRFPFPLGDGQGRHRLPVRAAIAAGGQRDREFEVEAVASKSDNPVVSQAATVSFVPGAALEVALFLGRSCVTIPRCSGDGSCQHGACVPRRQVGARRTLAPGERPGATSPADAGVVGDATLLDATVDAAVPDAGAGSADTAADGAGLAPGDASDATDMGGLPPGKRALLVIGDPAAPTAGDSRLRTVLESRGFEIRFGDDGGDLSEAAGVRLVVLASSCASATLGARFRDLATPVLTLDSGVFGDMRLTGATPGVDYGEEQGTYVMIVRPGHALAGIFTDAVTVVSRTAGMTWGRPAAGAIAVGTFQGMPGKIAIFGYEAGAAMVGMVAPARRVGLFAADASAEQLSPEGLQLLAAAIDWLTP